ncbi:hypothetical protein ES332_A04G036200v1 [Gossypium tomentosum]|uniref:Uncharacterized protein n=1 Tax=Gossypium tomentosum TaxID=34277 RepID=A0A5D2QUK3_GOSTO|nr:hypothetical protein ES332_A04G036200v1 [Gossypium tomentosum]
MVCFCLPGTCSRCGGGASVGDMKTITSIYKRCYNYYDGKGKCHNKSCSVAKSSYIFGKNPSL